ncbi:STAS domain-containing protein [Aggregatilineales bacterium SYSU G02658]
MMAINVTAHQQVTVVEVSGRVDGMNAGELGGAIGSAIDNGGIYLVLDLSQVDYMSSAGLRELVNSFKKAKRAAGDIRLAQPSERVREVLEMSGLDTVFRIFNTQAEAVASY